jgi:hypothetical protein
VLSQQGLDQGAVADVAAHEAVPRVVGHVAEVVEAAGVR